MLIISSNIFFLKRYYSNNNLFGLKLPFEVVTRLINIFEKQNRVIPDLIASDVKSLDIFSQKKGSSIFTSSIDVQLTSSEKIALVNYAEFCHRVACLMGFNSTGPRTLRYDIKKWSILKSPFIDKTSFKQYERRTYKRLIRISNAHPALHQNFLWYIQHHLPSDVEFSSTIFEYESINKEL